MDEPIRKLTPEEIRAQYKKATEKAGPGRFEHFTDRRVASLAEVRAIQTEKPVYNKTYTQEKRTAHALKARDGYEALARAILDENFGHRRKSS